MQWSKVVLAMVAAVLFAAAARADVFNMGPGLTSLTMVTVGDPGNAADTLVMTDRTSGYGSVSYTYQMGTFDVTAGQYCAFLNAVGATDPYGLYNSFMARGPGTAACGINQTGSSGNYSYNTTSSGYALNNGNFPVNWVSWGDAARFCNWVTNGQPTGPEGAGTTETGSYTLNRATSNAALMAVTRNADARYVIPTEDEWYKAAYYKGGGTNAGFWLYPTKSNTAPSNVLSSTGTNNANFSTGGIPFQVFTDPTNYLTVVGAFAGSPGPYGTCDMGGDVFQWNETNLFNTHRGLRCGAYDCTSGGLAASSRSYYVPTSEDGDLGFRVAEVPEPASASIMAFGAVCLFRSRRRK